MWRVEGPVLVYSVFFVRIATSSIGPSVNDYLSISIDAMSSENRRFRVAILGESKRCRPATCGSNIQCLLLLVRSSLTYF
jgi:hypothetical protein